MGERGGNLGLIKNYLRDFPQKRRRFIKKCRIFFNKNAGDFFTSLGEIGLKASRWGKGPCKSRERG